MVYLPSGNQFGTLEEVGVMPKWGSTDFEELKRLQLKINQAANADFDALCIEISKELARIFLAKVKKRTPVGKKPVFKGKDNEKLPLFQEFQENREIEITKKGKTYKKIIKGKRYKFLTKEGAILDKYWKGYTGGTLRRGWTIGAITRKPNGYEVEIINPVEYASYVEFGHRQTPGRYVPQIGKKLKRAWSPGKFMMTFTEQEVKSMAPGMIQKRFEKFLREVMSGDK